MRRASQRHSLVTLNEINITPLLDLAFVLLIIFIITRPLIEQSMQLDLPSGGAPAPRLEAKDITRVEISSQGALTVNSQPVNTAQFEQVLTEMHRNNPKLVVQLAADRSSLWGYGATVIDICQKYKISLNIQMKEPSQSR